MERLARLVVSVRSWGKKHAPEKKILKCRTGRNLSFFGLGGAVTRIGRELYEMESVAEHLTYREPLDTHR